MMLKVKDLKKVLNNCNDDWYVQVESRYLHDSFEKIELKSFKSDTEITPTINFHTRIN
jgi:hypothetical protein